MAVLAVAAVTFAFLAIIGESQQSHMETDSLLDEIQTQIVHLGSIHSAIANTNDVSDAALASLAQTRVQLNANLEDFGTRFDNTEVFNQLNTAVAQYLTTLDALIASARAGTLTDGFSPLKGQAATTVLNVGNSIREARTVLGDESSSAWRTTLFGFIGAITFLVIYVLVITRATEQRLRQALLERERDRLDRERHHQFAALVENISDAIIVLDRMGQISYASPASGKVLGVDRANLTGQTWSGFLHHDDRDAAEETMFRLVEDGENEASETLVVRVQHDNREWAWIEAIATNYADVNGIDGIVINARDITARRLAEETLRYRAFHDPLTGLANRTVLSEHIEKALKRRRRTGTTFAVMFVDLDDFKYINDTWGHATGDDLLVSISGRLRSVMRDVDMAARLGGDEFVLVINDLINEEAALTVADRVHNVLATAFPIGNSQCNISASLGIAIAGRSPNETVDDLLRDADIAMYRAKREGRNRSHVYSSRGETGRLISISA